MEFFFKISLSLSVNSPPFEWSAGTIPWLTPRKKSTLILSRRVLFKSPQTTRSAPAGIIPTESSEKPAERISAYSLLATHSSPRRLLNFSKSSVTRPKISSYSLASRSIPHVLNCSDSFSSCSSAPSISRSSASASVTVFTGTPRPPHCSRSSRSGAMISSLKAFISRRFRFSPPSNVRSQTASHLAKPRIPIART